MARASEEISKNNINGAKTDANIANDALHLGGIPADEFATEKYVQDYHGAKEELQKQYIDSQDAQTLQEAKDYTDTVVANQDFSSFAKVTDVQTLNVQLTQKINRDIQNLENRTDSEIASVEANLNSTKLQLTGQIDRLDRDVDSANSNILALQRQLSSEINARDAADKSLNNRIGNAEGDISNLERTTEELFTSVSNGKRKVAAAITDKGVQTASDATFDTMANNIENIPSGTDTSDATATEADIMFGKTAYSQGFKRYGTHRDLDTSDADATANDILLGKSAYVNGNKIYGTYVPDGEFGYPTYGTNTNNATANPADISYGKTAYVGGQYIVGTANPNVQEVYGTIKENQFYSYNLEWKDSDVYSIEQYTLSKNCDYLVRLVRLDANDDTDWAIESFQLDDNGMIRLETENQGGNVVTKKYRYTKSELGFDADLPFNYIEDIKFGCPGYAGSNTKCLLIISSQTLEENQDWRTKKSVLHLYTYHLTENGAIGYMYSNETDVLNNYEYQLTYNTRTYFHNHIIITSNLNPYEFYVHAQGQANLDYGWDNYTFHLRLIRTPLTIIQSTTDWQSLLGGLRSVPLKGHEYITSDGKFLILGNPACSLNNTSIWIILLDNNGEPQASLIKHDHSNTMGVDMIPGTNKLVEIYNVDYNVSNYNTRIAIINLVYDGTYVLSPTVEKTLIVDAGIEDNSKLRCLGFAKITLDQERLITFAAKTVNSQYIYYPRIVDCDFQDILDAADGDTVSITNELYNFADDYGSTEYLSNYNIPECYRFFSDFNDSKMIVKFKNEDTVATMLGNNTNNLIGIKYKGNYFTKFSPNELTAGQPDVAVGKTFVGWMGYPEVGTKV